jgi:hypothetical protein
MDKEPSKKATLKRGPRMRRGFIDIGGISSGISSSRKLLTAILTSFILTSCGGGGNSAATNENNSTKTESSEKQSSEKILSENFIVNPDDNTVTISGVNYNLSKLDQNPYKSRSQIPWKDEVFSPAIERYNIALENQQEALKEPYHTLELEILEENLEILEENLEFPNKTKIPLEMYEDILNHLSTAEFSFSEISNIEFLNFGYLFSANRKKYIVFSGGIFELGGEEYSDSEGRRIFPLENNFAVITSNKSGYSLSYANSEKGIWLKYVRSNEGFVESYFLRNNKSLLDSKLPYSLGYYDLNGTIKNDPFKDFKKIDISNENEVLSTVSVYSSEKMIKFLEYLIQKNFDGVSEELFNGIIEQSKEIFEIEILKNEIEEITKVKNPIEINYFSVEDGKSFSEIAQSLINLRKNLVDIKKESKALRFIYEYNPLQKLTLFPEANGVNGQYHNDEGKIDFKYEHYEQNRGTYSHEIGHLLNNTRMAISYILPDTFPYGSNIHENGSLHDILNNIELCGDSWKSQECSTKSEIYAAEKYGLKNLQEYTATIIEHLMKKPLPLLKRAFEEEKKGNSVLLNAITGHMEMLYLKSGGKMDAEFWKKHLQKHIDTMNGKGYAGSMPQSLLEKYM